MRRTLRKWMLPATWAFLLVWPVAGLSQDNQNPSAAGNSEPEAASISGLTNALVPASPAISDALQRALAILKTGARNYPEHRSCFSCHHQTLPVLTMSLMGRSDVSELPAGFADSEAVRSIKQFTMEAFDGKRETMREGNGVGGGALTVGYGLWVFDMIGEPTNATIDAMVEYLLKTQAEDGGWNFQSTRPPAASSRAMTSAIALYGLRAYADSAENQPRILSTIEKLRQWTRTFAEPDSHEDAIGQTWLAHQLGESEMVEERLEKLLASQRSDGGWAQASEMSSDAYATGQALLMIAHVANKNAERFSQPVERGIAYLLTSQKSDGSWHVVTRAKPVQVFFDNGDPHGKDQFISMMATAWAGAALANFQSSGTRPLESFHFARRAASP